MENQKPTSKHHGFVPALIVILAVCAGVFVIALWMWPSDATYVPVSLRHKKVNTNTVTNTTHTNTANTNTR